MNLDSIPYKNHVLWTAGLIVVGVGFWTMYQSGATNMKHKKDAEISKLKTDFATAGKNAAEAHAKELGEVNKQLKAKQALAEQISIDLENANAQNKVLANSIKKGIPHAIEKDKATANCINGLGPSSLHIYRQALGYGAN